MRSRMARSGMGPAAAERFSRTWWTRGGAGNARVKGGCGKRDGDGWVRKDELQDELRPARRAEFGRPFGERLILEPVGQRALPERPVDDHGDAALRRQRQQPRLRL